MGGEKQDDLARGRRTIKVLIVDDSTVARELLVHILGADPEIEVLTAVPDGAVALEAVQRYKPDVITMDINMPKMNGFDATRRVMETQPTPIVIVTASWDSGEVATTFRAIEAGALIVVPRPPGPGHPDHEAQASELLQLVKLMSEVKVVRRWARVQRAASVSTVLPVQVRQSRANIGLVVIGASTGGPLALQTLVAGLPTRFPAPVVIVQHMATGFVEGFVQWLASACNRQVCIAEHGERLRPGIVYVGLDGYEMTVSVHESIALAPCQGRNALCPSISALFRSAAEIFGPRAVGVLLSGMGKDGALELKVMKERGAITFAQDLESSIVHGMPGEAIRLGGASYILPPAEIAAALAALVE